MTKVRKELRRRRKPLGLATALVALAAVLVFAFGASANLPGSTFEGNDGNLVVNTAGNTDWINAPNRHVAPDLPTGTQDNSFGQGAKEDNVNTTVVTGSIPNSKADLASFYEANETAANGDVFLYLGWSRQNQSGTTNFDFEINQAAQPNLLTPGPKVLNRTTGDLLINYLFQGQGTPQVNFRTWTGSAWSAPTDASAFSEAAINGASVANIAGQTPDPLPAGQFGELAINLTAAGVFPPGVCKGFGSAYVKSRSSTAFNSEIKDFIAPVGININNCSTLIVRKVTVPSPDPGDASFAFSETGPGGFTDSFSLKDGEQDTNADVNPGTYTASETDPGPNYVLTSAVCSDGSPVTAIALGQGETVTCTFTNTLQVGALKIVKESTKTGNPLVSNDGAVFSYDSSSVTDNGTGDEDSTVGVVCVSGLLTGDYTVNETSPPTGYGSPPASEADQVVTVVAGTNCTDNVPGAGATATFTNPPLSDIQVNFRDGGSGETSATITCDDSTGTADTTAATGWDTSRTVTGVEAPTDIHCTISIDP